MTLYVGYRASDIKPEMIEEGAVFHTLDIYHRHAIEKVWHAKAICSPHLPEGPWDRICFKTGPKLMSGELELDLFQECLHVAADKKIGIAQSPNVTRAPSRGAADDLESGIYLDYVGRERDRNDLLDKIRDRTDRVFESRWKASVPGGEPLEFISYPGCFCHRRLDEGGLALAEVVARELAGGETSNLQPSTFSLLDMGCGCGLVGLLIADRLKKSAIHNSSFILHNLTLVDSHSRAIEAAAKNAANLGIPAEVILADNGTPARLDGTFDVFVGNPPYYSDYRIAEVFLETAKRALKPGGVCYTVCKNAAGLEPVQRKYFPDVTIIKRRGYAVLKSTNTIILHS